MKKSRKNALINLILLLAVFTVASVYYFSVVVPSHQKKEAGGKVYLIDSVSPTEVKSITLNYNDSNHISSKTSLVRKENGWLIISPIEEKADGEVVSKLLKDLPLIKSESVLTNVTVDHLKDYGFDQPYLAVEIVQTGGRTNSLISGGRDSSGRFVYVMIPSETTVYIVPSELVLSMEKKTDDFRDKVPFEIALKDLRFLDVRNGNQTFQFEQTDAEKQNFRMLSPQKINCDSMAVKSTVLDLYTLSIAEFLPELPVPEKTGLNRPRYYARIISISGITNELTIGSTNESGQYYAVGSQYHGGLLIEGTDLSVKFSLNATNFYQK